MVRMRRPSDKALALERVDRSCDGGSRDQQPLSDLTRAHRPRGVAQPTENEAARWARSVVGSELAQARRLAPPDVCSRDHPQGARWRPRGCRGLLLVVLSPAAIASISRVLIQHEASKQPHDYLATHLL